MSRITASGSGVSDAIPGHSDQALERSRALQSAFQIDRKFGLAELGASFSSTCQRRLGTEVGALPGERVVHHPGVADRDGVRP